MDYTVRTIRPAAIMTNSYVECTTLSELTEFNQVVLNFFFTIGSLTNMKFKVEKSNDGTNWTQETFSSYSGGDDTMTLGSHTIAASGGFEYAFPILTRYIKVSVIGTGTVTDSSLAITATLGVV